ncbi:MAG: RidA family protein [Cohnella sp.]|nr:RidA family protein [Cohnella sp.]
MGIIESRLVALGIDLPEPSVPVAAYVPVVTVDNLAFTSGTGCRVNGKLMYEGQLGRELTADQGRQAARQSAINTLAALQAHLGDLDRIERIVKLLGFVNSSPDFALQPYVIDGASELLMQLFGESGQHARSAVAAPVLPFHTPVSIEMIVRIRS